MVDDDSNDIQPYVDDILDSINKNSSKKVKREEIESHLKKFIDYGVPIEHAKQTLLKKYGDIESTKPSSGGSERVLVVDLQSNDYNVSLLGRVISVNPKQISVKGENKTIYYGILSDESGTVTFTAWNDFGLKKGDVIEISNAYTKEWQGAVQVNFGDRTTIEKTDENKLSASNYEPKECKIKDLRSGMGSVDIFVRIIELSKRQVTVNGENKNVYSGICGDQTGKARLTSWHDFNLTEGDVIQIKGGYIRSWRGIPQITFDEKASVKKLPNDKISKSDIITKKVPLSEIVERHGALDVITSGTVIDIRPGSGLIRRCPECKRVLQADECSVHGKVQSVLDLRIKMVLDDGTGGIAGILGKEISEKLLGKKLSDFKALVKKESDESIVIDEIKNELFARQLQVEGNALGDMYGVTLIAKDATLISIDVAAETEKLIEELERFK